RLSALAEVRARIAALATPVAPRTVELRHAQNRILAEDVTVAAPVPAGSIALRDGWAVRCDLVSDAGPYAPAALAAIPAFVEAGAPMPPDTDAVLAPDALAVRGGMAEALASAAPGEGVVAAGGDCAADAPLRRAGERLRSVDLAVLRAARIAHVRVREPRVLVLCASVEAAEDHVSPLIMRAAAQDGAVASVGYCPTPEVLHRAMIDPAADL